MGRGGFGRPFCFRMPVTGSGEPHLRIHQAECRRRLAVRSATEFDSAFSAVVHAQLRFRVVRGKTHHHTDLAHPLGLTRSRSERPRCRAAQHSYELPAPHWITPSARINSVVGSPIPSLLALLRLTIRSNLTARSIGRSVGGVPFRILSTNDAERK